jgi:hypothetical protein
VQEARGVLLRHRGAFERACAALDAPLTGRLSTPQLVRAAEAVGIRAAALAAALPAEGGEVRYAAVASWSAHFLPEAAACNALQDLFLGR